MRPFEPVFRRLPPSGLSSNKHKSVHTLRRELSICLFSLENVWRYSRKRTRAKALYVVIQIQMETLLVVNVLLHLRAAYFCLNLRNAAAWGCRIPLECVSTVCFCFLTSCFLGLYFYFINNMVAEILFTYVSTLFFLTSTRRRR